MKKKQEIDFSNVELDLFFQCWREEVDAPEHYSIKLLYEAYLTGCNKEEFYYRYVFLPF